MHPALYVLDAPGYYCCLNGWLWTFELGWLLTFELGWLLTFELGWLLTFELGYSHGV